MIIRWIHFNRLERDLDLATAIEITKELRRKGHNVQLYFPYTDVKLGTDSDCIVYIKTVRARLFYTIIYLGGLLCHLLPCIFSKTQEIIFIDYMPVIVLFPFIILAHFDVIRTRFVLDVRSIPVEIHDAVDHIKNVYFALSLFLVRNIVSGITVISRFMKKYLVERFHITETKIDIWTSGVSPELFSSSDENHSFNKKAFSVMYHGLFGISRGLQETIRAVNLLHEEFPCIHLLLLGNGPAKEQIEKLIRNLQLCDHVTVKDSIPHNDVPSVIRTCDVGILPFPHFMWWRVSSPIKLFEYLSMGKPVIATDIEAHRDVIGNAPCGIYIKSYHPNEIAKGIKYAIENRMNLSKWGAIGRKIVIEEYTWQKQASRLITFLESINGS